MSLRVRLRLVAGDLDFRAFQILLGRPAQDVVFHGDAEPLDHRPDKFAIIASLPHLGLLMVLPRVPQAQQHPRVGATPAGTARGARDTPPPDPKG